MIGVGSLVRYVGSDKRFWKGKYLSVHARKENGVVVYVERNEKGKWKTATIPLKDVEEVVS